MFWWRNDTMSITRMVGAEKAGQPNVEKIDYPGHPGPLFMETTHIGLVIRVGERNYHDDSDFYAVVWNPQKACPEEIEYATTRAWTYPNHAEVDATPIVQRAYEAYVEAESEASAELEHQLRAKQPEVGKRVRVVRGRKVPIGTEGVIFWMQPQTFSPRFRNGYKTGPDTIKIGIALNQDRDAKNRYVNVAWTYAQNVEVVQ